MTKSSANRTRKQFPPMRARTVVSNHSSSTVCRKIFARIGEITPPCGVPVSVRTTFPSSSTPTCSHIPILRLIGMWLHVGVLEEGKVVRTETGTPQGGVISPILANIFLHTVLDEWFETTVRARMGGNCFLVRFADDFVMGYAFKGDAEKVFRVLPKRFERYGLSIHPEKSRLVQFSRPYWRQGKGPWV